MTTFERSILKDLIAKARDLARQYAEKTGWPLNDLRIMDAADSAERVLLDTQDSSK